MPSTRNPASLTPDERTAELARLLSTGLVRLGSALLAPGAPVPEVSENAAESAPNELAEGPGKSVTGTGG